MSLSENKYPVVCYGEILWDVLPDRVVPGGAPMNVAFHLKNLGINPALITRIGHDQEGKKLIQLLEKKHISTDFFQMDFKSATGKVIALPGDAGEVRYDIMKPVAWDYIGWEEQYDALVSNASFFVFGSLAARSNTSRNTLYRLLEQATDKVQIERKTFVFTLKENPRGRFLRITEDVGGRRDTIIIPAPGLEDFKKLLDEMVKAANDAPPPGQSSE